MYHSVTKIAMHVTSHRQGQCTDSIQTRSRIVHHRGLLRQNHKEKKDKEIAGLKLTIHTVRAATEIAACMSIKEI